MGCEEGSRGALVAWRVRVRPAPALGAWHPNTRKTVGSWRRVQEPDTWKRSELGREGRTGQGRQLG